MKKIKKGFTIQSHIYKYYLHVSHIWTIGHAHNQFHSSTHTTSVQSTCCHMTGSTTLKTARVHAGRPHQFSFFGNSNLVPPSSLSLTAEPYIIMCTWNTQQRWTVRPYLYTPSSNPNCNIIITFFINIYQLHSVLLKKLAANKNNLD